MIDLREMLTYRRPHRSRSERKFINRFIRPVGVEEDTFGNLIARVGDDQRVMFASHTDTVHKSGGRQRVFAGTDGFLRTDLFEDCLGADDTTGVWLMLNLIRQGVNGLYVFHRAEETGCHGSRWIATETPEVVEDVKVCISLDRRGYDSIVTHQCGVRTASDAFAEGLALQLDLGYRPDPTGLFTDSLEYAHLIPECTNISVGYGNAHTGKEFQDFGFALALLRTLNTLDPDFLPVEREPGYDGWTEVRSVEDYYAADDEVYRKGSSSVPFGMKYGDTWGDDIPPLSYGGIKASDVEWD